MEQPHREKYRTDKLFCCPNKILALIFTKKFLRQKTIINSFVISTNRFVRISKHLLGQQKMLSVLYQQSGRLMEQFMFMQNKISHDFDS